MIRLNNIKKIYNKGSKENELIALNDLDLEISEGEFLAIMGPSGSGKTTLLNILGLMDSFDQGEYHFLDTQVEKLNRKKMDKFRSQKIGFVFQQFMLLPDYTVFENAEIPLRARNIKRSKRKEIIMKLLEQVGMEKYAKTIPSRLSGGQKQRCAIVRALVNEPDLILADEPTGALDRKTGQEIMNLLKELNKKGKTIIVVTHDPTVADKADRIINLEDGRIISDITKGKE